ncbi:hypothetical protein O0880_14020 [Janthinobacterium sp. SUN118]|uniref:hypothetical protein n=1 Tax=Janthinobacterium sp. SUN118 TaxID=3004100 RepID=UPI0025B03E8F|nr:hypothetical protein [Janthinobacterium sp. SUN118]MDN2710538.1 hypothetical protein [Janthinobacterium sp. SUN118]
MYLLLRGTHFVIDGMHLLALCEKLAGAALTARHVHGSGTTDKPFVPETAEDWLNSSQRMKNTAGSGNDNVYFNVCGRLLHKDVKVYFSDIGPVWRKGLAPNDMKGLDDRHLLEHSTMGVNDLAAWKNNNTLSEPTYQVGAQRIADPASIFPNSKPFHASEVPSWNTLEKAPMVAKAMRDIMKRQLKVSIGKNYSRLQHGLPVFVAAIFLAEPSRNIRAWPINLMLLDIAEGAVPGFTWGAILWHPLALQPVGAFDAVPGPELRAPVGKADYARDWSEAVRADDKARMAELAKKDHSISRAMGPVTRAGQLHLLGGKMPSSPTKGGEIGSIALFDSIVPAHPRSKNQQPSVKLAGARQDYIHVKEIEVVLTWLLTFPDIASEWEQRDSAPNMEIVDLACVFGVNSSNDPRLKGKAYPPTFDLKLDRIRNKIIARIASLERHM